MKGEINFRINIIKVQNKANGKERRHFLKEKKNFRDKITFNNNQKDSAEKHKKTLQFLMILKAINYSMKCMVCINKPTVNNEFQLIEYFNLFIVIFDI